MYRRFLFLYLALTISALCLIAVVNFVVDPSGIYLKRYLNERYLNEYADKIVLAKTGIRAYENERAVKMKLAERAADFACIILGSSRVMSLSIVTSPSSLKQMCPTALNLGVSGASFEDLLIFSRRVLSAPRFTRKPQERLVLIEVDPWLFKWEMDSRYGLFKDDLQLMKNMLAADASVEAEPYWIKLMNNLINLDYLEESIKVVRSSRDKGLMSILVPKNDLDHYQPVAAVDYDSGAEHPLTLPDGSHLYDVKHVRDSRTNESYVADGDFKLSGEFYSEEVIGVFKRLLEEYKKRGVRIALVLTPYHKIVFREANEKNWKYLVEVEKRVTALSKEMAVPLFGSYYPGNLSCTVNDFFDFMHPKKICLANIPFK